MAHKTNPFVGTETARAYVKRRAVQDPEFAVTFAEAYDRRKLARVIREAREHRQLSQSELAKLAGTRQPHIARLENAGASPTLELLHRVARALGLKLDVRFVNPRPKHA
jgi:ribosome-binding protein aMBF1 (putative translation factor)